AADLARGRRRRGRDGRLRADVGRGRRGAEAGGRHAASAARGLGRGLAADPARLDGRREPRGADGGSRLARPAPPGAPAGADPRRLPRAGRASQSVRRRKIATAFWPPNPKPWTATVSIRASRAVSGT